MTTLTSTSTPTDGTTSVDSPQAVESTISERLFIQPTSMIVGMIVFLALFTGVFLWGVTIRGVDALGLNACFLTLGLCTLSALLHKELGTFTLVSKCWLGCLALVGLSFAVYEHPFLQGYHLVFLPLAFCAGHVLMPREKIRIPSLFTLPFHTLLRPFEDGAKSATQLLRPRASAVMPLVGHPLTPRILKGGMISLVLLSVVIVPLLSSADDSFAALIEMVFGEWVQDIFEFFLALLEQSLVQRLIVTTIMAVFICGAWFAWQYPLCNEESRAGSMRVVIAAALLLLFFAMVAGHLGVLACIFPLAFITIIGSKPDRLATVKGFDPVVAGMVLGSTLITYVIFISMRLGTLFTLNLPLEFTVTESYVKQGFWQLLTLTSLNIFMVLLYNHKTGKWSQRILNLFTAASMVLLLSAGQRLALYCIYYGFSNEKWYAAYTVLYCAVAFILLARVQLNECAGTRVIHELLIALVVMYSAVSMFPTEYIIFRTNLALREMEESRINLQELKALSLDIMPLVLEQSNANGITTCSREFQRAIPTSECQWVTWSERRFRQLVEKKWYEHSLSSERTEYMLKKYYSTNPRELLESHLEETNY